jgi:hypothetical protein
MQKVCVVRLLLLPSGLRYLRIASVCICLWVLLHVQLDASEAARQAQAAAYRRVVGRGGLNEEAAEDAAGGDSAAAAAAGRFNGGVIGPSAGAGARRADAAVSEAQVVRHPSEAERVLRLLQQQINKLGMTRWVAGYSPVVLC